VLRLNRAASASEEKAKAATEEELVREHLPLVHYAVAELANRVPRHVCRDDLVSAAMLGLAQAARGFDPERGITFERFANMRIRGALLDELRDRDWASRSVRADARKLHTAAESLTHQLGRAPTPVEVAAELGIEPSTVESLLDDVNRATVLNYDAIVLDNEGESVLPANPVSPDRVILDREKQAYMVDAVRTLPDRLRTVIVGYFFEERSMQDLADELGVSESRISQMRAEALVLLRDGINSQLDPDKVAPDARPDGRIARRRAAYHAAIAASSTYMARVDARPRVDGIVPQAG
jgi:RNA polymerase sigma factor for flagellar operon FliA